MRFLMMSLLLLASSTFALSAFAQVYKLRDGQTQLVQLSDNEVNRISIAAGRVENIRGPAERMQLEADDNRGEVYLRTRGSSPFSLYVSADNGETYTLLVTPARVPGTTIILESASGASALPLVDNLNVDDKTAPYLVRIKNLMRVMQRDDGRYHQVQLNQPVSLGANLHLVREKLWPSAPGRLAGEKWRVTNVSDTAQALKERQFIHDYQVNNSLAVAIEKHVLQPGGTTSVFIIRRGSE